MTRMRKPKQPLKAPEPTQLEQLNQTQAAALLGEQVRGFVVSEIGTYLLRRADERAQQAMTMLGSVDPEKPIEIRKLQNEIRVADLFREFLSDAVEQGDDAMATLDAE